MAQNLQQGRKLSEAMIRALFVPFIVKSPHLRSHSPSLPSLGLFVRIAVNDDDVLEFHTASVWHKRLRLWKFIVQHLIRRCRVFYRSNNIIVVPSEV